MGAADFFLGQRPDYRSVPNPYTPQIAAQEYKFGPARKYFGQILRGANDVSNIPGVGQFNADLASRYEMINRTPRLGIGGSSERQNELARQRAEQDVGAQRMGYVGGTLNNAAGSLAEMFRNRNLFNLEKYNLASGQFNSGIRDYSRKPGGFINSLISGGSQVASAYATGGASGGGASG